MRRIRAGTISCDISRIGRWSNNAFARARRGPLLRSDGWLAPPAMSCVRIIAVNTCSCWVRQLECVPGSGQPGFGYTLIAGTTFARDYLTYVFHFSTASQKILNLIILTDDLKFHKSHKLLASALAHLNAGSVTPACHKLNAFINQVQAQTGKRLSDGGDRMSLT